jgi:hypothetical protein
VRGGRANGRRERLVAGVGAVVAVAATALATASPLAARPSAAAASALQARPAPARGERRVPAGFGVLGTGPTQRAIAIGFIYGGCEHAPRVSVAETARSVRIRVTIAEPTGRDVVCTAIARIARLAVRLRAPLHGRRILGWTARATVAPSPRCGRRVAAPRVLGMAAADATRALREQGFQAVVTRGGREIVVQHPAARTCMSRGGTVRLVAAR